jgi:hypothetical protein
VYRAFDASREVPPAASAPQREALARGFPDSLLLGFSKTGRSLAREFCWTGSHRYAILHLGGRDREHLRQRCEDASALLGWPAPYLDQDPLPARARVTEPCSSSMHVPSAGASAI